MNCWICGAERPTTREHRVKASDIRALFETPSQDEPIYFRTSAQPGTPRPRNLRVGSVKNVGDLTSHGIPEWGLRESALRNFVRNQITVANRRIEMREYQDALCRMRLSHTDRAISRDRVLGRRKLGELRAVAGDRG
jgi:hypothetical protein